MKAMRKSILACVLCLALCLGLFAGATFAWFTDTVSSTGNTITAGTLDVEAYAYDLAGDADQGMSVTIDGVNGGEAITFSSARQDLNKNDPPPIINESNWEPGQSSAKLLQVQNAGTLNAKVGIEFSVSGELTDALWFDFIQVDPSSVTDGVAGGTGSVIGTFTQREMNTLATFAQNLELTLEAANDGAADSIFFVFVYGMKTTAGNEYQNTSFTADVTVFATQATGEEDGFGNPDYDADAGNFTLTPGEGESLTQNDLAAALNDPNNKSVSLGADMTISESTNIYTDSVLDLGEKTITSEKTLYFGRNNGYQTAPITATIKNGTYSPTNNGGRIRVEGGSTLTMENVTFTNDNSSTVTVQAIQGHNNDPSLKNTYIFIGCTFDNAYVAFDGSSGNGYEIDVRFVDCMFTFDGLGNGGAAVSIDDYYYGSAVFEDCTFTVTGKGNGTAAIDIKTYPNYIGENTINVTLSDITFTGTSTPATFTTYTPVPVKYKDYIEGVENFVTITETGTCTYTTDGTTVDKFGNSL